uniref:Transporter n=1 Tax=Trichuris muris TaxID=70415 RepID=A0A5S6Q6S3_TRIMR
MTLFGKNSGKRSVALPDRLKWASKVEFVLALIGFSVDLGNVWRFPYICYRNGGGAFLIPYFVMFIFCGLPLFYMELALGQYHRCGCLAIWKFLLPILKGVGYATCLIDVYMGCFYNTVISWALFYLSSSFQSPVPWQTCNNSWNTDNCLTDDSNPPLTNATSLNGIINGTSAAEEFFLRNVLELHRSGGIEDMGQIKWQLLLCLFFIYLTVYFAIWKGPRSAGKAVWFTAIAPYVALISLLTHGTTLPGALSGIVYFLTPQWEKLLQIEVWIDAAAQIFFSLGPGFGVLIALSSYNDKYNNFYRDAFLVGWINCFTSILSGLVIFSTLGYMAHTLGKGISEMTDAGGPGLVFIIYPRAISTMRGAPIWSVLFFIMLLSLGIDSTFAGLEAIFTGFCDEYPKLLERHRQVFTGIFMIGMFIVSLPTITYGGNYLIEYLDHYAVSYSVLIVVMFEAVAVTYVYGVKRFCADVKLMLGTKPNIFLRFCWLVTCPVIVAVILICATLELKPLSMPNYVYPKWSQTLGWFVRLSSVICIPLYAVIALASATGTLKERWRKVTTPQRRNEASNVREPEVQDSELCHCSTDHISANCLN